MSFYFSTRGKWTGGIIGFLVVITIVDTWGDLSIESFAESLIANTIRWGSAIGFFVLAAFIGMKAAEKTRQSWIGWIAGVSFYLVAVFLMVMVVKQFPWLEERIDKVIEEREHYEQDREYR